MKRSSILLICLVVLAVLGCADPAKDQPKAAVGEPVPQPAAPATEEAERYVIGEGTTIGFVGSKVTGSHSGGFNNFEGDVLVVAGDPTRSSVNLTIDATSLWADDERLTGHLKSPDFFDVETYPTATFQSTAIAAEGGGYTMTGNLTLHGVTKSISFPAGINLDEEQVAARAKFAIKRFEFGLVYPGKADDLIRDDVVIRLNLVALRATAAESS